MMSGVVCKECDGQKVKITKLKISTLNFKVQNCR